MLRSLQSLKYSPIQATDGELGKVQDFLFEDDKWTVRYLIVKTGSWWTEKKVLISPLSILPTNGASADIRVTLTRDQIKHSPDIDTDQPVSRQIETDYHDYYQWPYYWGGAGIWGIGGSPSEMLGRPYGLPTPSSTYASEPDQPSGDPHLRSAQSLHGYGIEGTDHQFGSVHDFIIDTHTWNIRYLVVSTIKHWPVRYVIVSPRWVEEIRWTDQKLRLGLTEEQVKNSPEYNPNAAVNREYEARLYDYYGRPAYWTPDQVPPALGRVSRT